MSAKGWIILAILFVMGIFAYDFLTKKPEKRIPLVHMQDQFSSWVDFEPEDKSFKAKFPRAPQHARASDDAAFGSTKDRVVYHVYAAQSSDGSNYLIKEIRYPESSTLGHEEVLFDDVVRDMLKNTANSKLKDSKKGTFHNRPTRDFEIEAPSYAIKSRAFFVGNKLFVLTVMDKNPATLNQDFERFANSFQLTER